MDVGDKAPDFELPDQDGNTVRLSALLESGPVVVFFYPKDGSPVCTMEACSFRDNYHAFQKYGAAVLGVSSDDSESHRAFADKHHLSFPLLWDRDGALRKLWKVPGTLGVLPGRVTYVVDQGGVVRNVFSSQLEPEKHVTTALETVKKLAAMV